MLNVLKFYSASLVYLGTTAKHYALDPCADAAAKQHNFVNDPHQPVTKQ